jgi:tetrahydromethanopterin S-methyltransferase subunit G
MAATPTELLAGDVNELREANRANREFIAELRESNRLLATEFKDLSAEMREFGRRLATEMRESNQRLADALNRVSGDLGNFRVEIAKELGTINTQLEKYQAETATSLRFIGRSVAILIPVVIGLIGSAIGITWYAAKLDSRVEHVEAVVKASGKTDAAKR